MKRIRSDLPGLILVLVFALMAAACSATGSPATTTTAAPATTAAPTTTSRGGQPVGGEIAFGQIEEPATLNPFLTTGAGLVTTLIGNTYWTGVAKVSGDTRELVPVVVTELPTVGNGGIRVNPDGTMTITYQILEEARWADGMPISGDDFRFTYETIMNPAYPINRSVYQEIIPESIVAGAKSFEYTMVQPTLQHEFLFHVLIPMHDVEGSDFVNDYNDAPWVSGGPFMFDEWRKGSFIRVVRNPDYWGTDPATGQQLPHLDSILFPFLPDQAALIDAFRAREVDIINPELGTIDAAPVIAAIEELSDLEADGVLIDVAPGPLWEHLNFSFSERSLVRNPNSYNAHLEYRRAVAHAIDEERIVAEILGGHLGPMDSYVEAYAPALSPGSWAQYDYDPERARAYIAELCAKEGIDCEARPVTAVFTTTAGNAARQQLADLLAEMFADIGVAFTVELEPSAIFLGQTLDTGEWDFGQWSWTGSPGLSGLVGFHDALDPEGPFSLGANIYRYGTPAVEADEDAELNQGPGLVVDEHSDRVGELRDFMYATVDVEELRSYLAEVESILADQVVILPLYQNLDLGAVWANRVGGYVHNPLPRQFPWLTVVGDTWNVEAWYRADL